MSMRYFKVFWLTIFMSVLLSLTPERATYVSSIGSYRNNPGNVNRDYEISIPFRANYTTLLTYSYTVYDSSLRIIYTKNETSIRVPANVNFIISYLGKAGTFSAGRNMLYLDYKTLREGTRRHISSFYGFVPGVKVNLNKGSEAQTLLEAETCFIYDGVNNKSTYQKMNFSYKNLTPILRFEHDLYFDFNELYLSVGPNYDRDPSHGSAYLLCHSPSVFPKNTQRYLSATAFSIRLRRNNNRLYTYLVSYNNNYYVNTTTLEVANSQYNNEYIHTDTLFFPKNHFSSLQNIGFTMIIYGFSYSSFELSYSFSVEIDHPFLGTGGEHEVSINRY